MNYTPDPLTDDPLAQRLDALVIAVPPFPATALRAPRRKRPAGGHRVARRAGLAVVFAIAAALTTTIVAFPEALTAIGRDVLGLAGLTSGQVSPGSGEARHGQTALSVSGAYVDAVSTVVFATVTTYNIPCNDAAANDVAAGRCGDSFETTVDNNAPCQPAPEMAGTPCLPAQTAGPFLTDQFGQRYASTGGLGVGVGPYPIFFQPLRGEAQTAGAHLTLHLPITHRGDRTHQQSFELAVPLSGSLTPKTALPLPAEKPVVDGANGVTYEAPDLKSSGTFLQAHTRLSGRLDSVITNIGGGQVWPGIYLIDEAGHYQIPLAVDGPGPSMVTDTLQDETRLFSLHGPGTYRLVIVHDSNPGAAPGGRTSRVLAQWSITIR